MNILNKVTLKNLMKNRTRTLVTIIGIILSVSLFTAVTTSVNSLKTYIIEVTKEKDGDFHGGIFDVNGEKLEEIVNDERAEMVTTIQNIGYAKIDEIENEYKPYLYIGAMDPEFSAMMPVNLLEGKMPGSSREILLPDHLETNGGASYRIGDVISLEVGERLSEGVKLHQTDSYITENEELEKVSTRTYTITGIYERPSFEGYSAPGYTALTLPDGAGPDSFDAYIRVDHMKDTYAFLEAYEGYDTRVNSDLLRFSGNSNENTLNAVLYSMVAILSAIIMFGSISLIYNAFSISISERTKQFGLLKSVGATKKQILSSVLFEALVLSGIGIPLGILLGIAGIGLTFVFSSEVLNALWAGGTKSQLVLRISPESLLIAAALGLVTVLLSAWIPARKAARVSAIDSIRQTDDIRIRPGKVKTSRLTYKLFGFDGMLAAKNFKRNRRKYRATVVSLFMSVVLFISASSFTSYLKKGTEQVFEEMSHDITYYLTPSQENSPEEVLKLLSGAEGVNDTSYEYSDMYSTLLVPKDVVTEGYAELMDMSYYEEVLKPKESESIVNMHLAFLDDESFRSLLAENGLSEEEYMAGEAPKALVYASGKVYDSTDSRYYTFDVVKNGSFSARQVEIPSLYEDRYFSGEERDGKLVYTNGEGEDEVLYAREEVIIERDLVLGEIISTMPMMSYNANGSELKVIYPYSAMEKIIGEPGNGAVNLYFEVEDHAGAYREMSEILKDADLSFTNLVDQASYMDQNRAMITVINIFSYGFIILISLIAAANVFNTISTNIHLRRREFAMLKTVGMTTKGFNKMMTYESILYGVKGVLYGIPVAIGVTYLIYLSMNSGIDFAFFIPWIPVILAVGSVFLVVFATSIYAMDKIRKDNPIDALKNENI